MARRVHRLTLRAGSEAGGRALLPRLEDALRCASLPDAGARLLLVRRLTLGRVAPQASSQAIARLIEARFAASAAEWTEGEQGDAPGAEQVVFRSAWHARVALARLLLQGRACSAWYWPLAVAEYRPGAAAGDNVRAIACAVALSREARAALPAWAVRVVQGSGVQALAAAVPAALGQALVERAGLHVATGAEAQAAEGAQAATADAAPPWLACLLRAGGWQAAPAARPVPRIQPAEADGTVVDVDTPPIDGATPDASDAPPAMAPAQRLAHSPMHRTEAGQRSAAPPDEAMPVPAVPVTGADRDRPVPDPVRHIRGRPEPGAPAVVCDALPTAFGGLPFLLPVLARLGLPDWAASASADPRAWTCAVLAAALDRLQAPADDPMRLLIAGEAPLPRAAAAAPASWQSPLLAPPRGAPAVPLPQALADAATAQAQAELWLTAARRWLRRGARIGLASLVHRPGRLDLTPTHADLHFRLAATDLRVRRAGLDIDPGWLPWFGRVVAYHYGEGAS